MQTSTHTHTPGPWHRGDEPGQETNPFAVYAENGRLIHRSIDDWNGSAEDVANARLIAAAPALLDALAALVDVQDKREAGDISWDFAWADARAALAAATGEDV